MKLTGRFLIIALLLLSLALPCKASGEANDPFAAILSGQLEMISPEQFDRYIDRESSSLLKSTTSRDLLLDIIGGRGLGDIGDILRDLMQYIYSELFLGLKTAAKLAAVVLAAALVSALGGEMSSKRMSSAAVMVCSMAAIVVAGGLFTRLAAGGLNSIERIASLVRASVPVMALLFATGAKPVTAASLPALIIGLTALTNEIIVRVFFPLLYGYTALCAADSAFCENRFTGLCSSLKSFIAWGLGICFSVFAGLLAIQGASLSVADGLGVKTVKFALSSFVPVVGSILSDASEVVLGCAGLVTGAFGILAVILCLGICVAPAVKIAVSIAVFKLLGAVSELMGGGRLGRLFEGFASSFTLLLAMLAGNSALFIVAAGMLVFKGG